MCLCDLFYIPTTVFPPSSPPSLSPCLPATPPNPPLFCFCLGKGHGYQPNIAYQIAVRLRTFPCIKVGQGNPVWGIQSQMSAKEWKPLLLLLGAPQEDQATAVTYTQRFRWVLCRLTGCRFFLCEPRLIDSVVFLLVSLTPVTPTVSTPVFLRIPWTLAGVWLLVSLHLFLSVASLMTIELGTKSDFAFFIASCCYFPVVHEMMLALNWEEYII